MNDVLVVVVLYKRAFEDVPCALRLKHWLATDRLAPTRFRLTHCLVYDNSPVMQPFNLDRHKIIEVFHDPNNGGTKAAYLYALKAAIERECEWILLLDHDTDLPIDFFTCVEHTLKAVVPDLMTAAVVPHIFDRDNLISPSCITSYGRVGSWRTTGEKNRRFSSLTAIASAALVRTESLAVVLPIPANFSLDYLDHWLFRELQRHGESIAVSSARVEHSLSVQSMKSMSIDRYRAILAAELEFLRSGTQYSSILHLFWHTGRTLKLMLSTRRPSLVGVCVRAALNILRTK